MNGSRLTVFLAPVACALLFAFGAHAASPAHSGRLSDYEQTSILDDRELLMNPAGIVCFTGVATDEHPNPAAACMQGYSHALRIGRYEEAMRYATLGCTKYRNANDCRRAGALPLMINNGRAVPESFASELTNIADFVCLSGARLMDVEETDITGRECSNLARLFVLVKDPEYTHALEPHAHTFFTKIHDPDRALALHDAACWRLDYALGCERTWEIVRYRDSRPH